MADKHQLRDMKAALRERMPARQINEAILISLRNRFVFTRVSKVANSSLKHLVYSMEKPTWAGPVRDDLIHDSQYGPVIRPAMLGLSSPILHRALYSDTFFRFTFVRNPYAKALSTYLDRYMAKHSTVRRLVNEVAVAQGWLAAIEDPVDFPTFLRAIAEMPQRHMEVHISPQYIQTLSEVIPHDFIGALETLAEDTSHVARRIWGRDDAALGFKSPSRTDATTRLKDSYRTEDIALINRLYQRDFEMFGYRMVQEPEAFSDPDVVFRKAGAGAALQKA